MRKRLDAEESGQNGGDIHFPRGDLNLMALFDAFD